MSEDLDRYDAQWHTDSTTAGTFYNSDMSGFTRLTKKHGILHFLGMIMKMRSIVRPIIKDAGGKIVHFDGDNVIARFPDATVGSKCALQVQQTLRKYNAERSEDHRIILKIGLADGDVLDTGLQLFGDTWELCEELGEELGKKRQVLMSKGVRDRADLSEFGEIIEHETVAEHDGHPYFILQRRVGPELLARVVPFLTPTHSAYLRLLLQLGQPARKLDPVGGTLSRLLVDVVHSGRVDGRRRRLTWDSPRASSG